MVSKHLNALEHALDTQIFIRSTRKLTLTDDGQQYLAFCRRILAEVSEGEDALRNKSASPSGILRISAPYQFGRQFLAPLLGKFMSRYPDLRVELNLSDRKVDLVDEGWDMAIRIGEMKDDSLRARKFGETRGVLVASPDYLARRGIPKTGTELVNHDLLGYSLSESIGARSWRVGPRPEDKISITPRLVSNSGSVLVEAAKAGLGLAVHPEYAMKPMLHDGTLVPVTLESGDILGSLGLYAVYPAVRQTPVKVRVMIDFLLEAFKDGIEIPSFCDNIQT